MIKYLIPAILIVIIAFILLFKWPVVDEKNKKKIINHVQQISNFYKKISIPGDKSISIRWVLLSSLASGVSKAKNLLMSEDVIASLRAVKKLGVKVVLEGKDCKIYGVGVGGYKYKKNIVINI